VISRVFANRLIACPLGPRFNGALRVHPRRRSLDAREE
jgi:hypothetical protein